MDLHDYHAIFSVNDCLFSYLTMPVRLLFDCFSIILTAAHCVGIFLAGAFVGGTTYDGQSGSTFIAVAKEYPNTAYGTFFYQRRARWPSMDDTVFARHIVTFSCSHLVT